MTTKVKNPRTKSAPARPKPIATAPGRTGFVPREPGSADTLAERLQCIEDLGRRVEGHIHFMAEVASMNGTSVEAKNRVIAVFHERLVQVEAQLNRIREEFRLE